AADVEKQRQGRAGMMDARVFIKGLVALLMVVLALWVVVGAGFLVHELYLALEQGWEKRAEHMVVN
ncbi:MAG: hypothetical protein GWO23_18215, partial [Gammaproteobacteria bacterium]|nr:hypothetical protein [Gammaproteobacteria bacterium]